MLSRSRPQSLRCTYCRAENYSFAPFCIRCGEPFDPPEAAAPPAYSEQRAPLQGQAPHTGTTPKDAPGIYYFARREAVLGILLVVVVLGVAGWNWQHQNNQAEAYKQGLADQKKKSWDAAAEAFARAGDHLGAANQASNARAMIAERNKLYLSSIIAGERKDWPAALTALERVQEIEPGYANTAERLTQAKAGAAALRLGGIAYLSTEEGNSGLFFIDGKGSTVRFPGSDSASLIRGSSPEGTRVVYDVPAQSAPKSVGLEGIHAGNCLMMEGPAPTGRVPVMAVVGSDTIQTYPMPNVEANGAAVFTPDALYWYTDPSSGTSLTDATVSYIKTGPKGSTAVQVVGPDDKKRLLAFDPQHSRLILGQEEWSPITGKRLTRVYTADLIHNIFWTTRTVEGEIKSASVSRDGRWLLVTAEVQVEGVRRMEVWAISLETVMNGDGVKVAGPVTLLGSVDESRTGAHRDISAHFIPPGNMPVRAAVDRVRGDAESITIHNLDSKQANEIWSGSSTVASAGVEAGFNSSGELLASPRKYGSGALLELLTLARSDFVRWFNVPLPSGSGRSVRVSFAPRNDYIVAAAENKESGPEGGEQVLLSAAHVNREGDLSQMHPIGSAAAYDAALPTVAAPKEDSLLAYISPDLELRAVDYEGKASIVITQNAAAVWSLGSPDDLAWTRQR